MQKQCEAVTRIRTNPPPAPHPNCKPNPRYPESFEFAETAADVRRIFASGKIASVCGMEGGHQMNDSLGCLRMFHRLGVRYMTLTHNGGPGWADPAMERDETSLSENGSDSSGSRSSGATPDSHTLMIPDGPDNNDANRIESFCDMTRNWVRSLSGKLACVSLKTNLLVIVLVVMVIVQSYAMVLLPRRCSTPPAPPAHMPPWCEPLQ